MILKRISCILYIGCMTSFVCLSQTTEQLKENLLAKENSSIYNFDLSIDTVSIQDWQLNDTISLYIKWLYENKDILLDEGNPYFKVHVLLELAKAKFLHGEHDESCDLIDSTFQYFQPFLSQKAFVKINKLGAQIANEKADFSRAISYYEKILELIKVSCDSLLLSDVYQKLADFYSYNDQYDKSMFYSNKAYPFLLALDKKPELISLFITMFNNAQLSSNDTSSMEYIYKATDLAKEYGDSLWISATYYNLGVSYYRKADLSEAIKYYIIARNYANDKGSKREVRIAVFQHLAYTYMPDSVERACETSDYILKRSLINNDQKLLSNAYLSRANCFANHGNRDSTIYYLNLAEDYRIKYGNSANSSGFYNKMHEVYMKINDYQNALKYLDKALSDQVKSSKEANANQLSETRAKLDYQIQKKQISDLQYQNELQHEKNKQQKILISSILIILVLGITFMGYAFRKYNELKGSYREVFRKNIELDKLNFRLSQTEEKLQVSKSYAPNGNGSGGIKDEEKIYLKLKRLLETDKIYKQPDISAGKLARKLKTNTSYLSIIINSRFEDSFKSLINKYRINEARKLLASPEYSNFSIEGIAEEVGYNSRSAFYQSFRQITGLTPTQYLENLKDPENKLLN